MANEISKTPTPSLASGQSEVLMGSHVFSALNLTSPIIVVDREPVKVVVFGLTGDATVTVHQVFGVNDDLVSEEYRPYPQGLVFSSDRNEIILQRSGRYRLVGAEITQEVRAFWWNFSMTHEWTDIIEEALRYLCACVRPNDVELVAGNGILVENLGGGTWRVTNTAIHTAVDTATVDHQIVSGVLSSHVKLSEDPGNEMFARDDGLYATISDPNAPCNLGNLVQPFNGRVRNARFLVLDNQGCIRWVRARSLANYICDFECEEEPPPSSCCALTFTHSVQTIESVGVGTTVQITLTATGSNSAACRAFTNSLAFSPLIGQSVNGWRYDGVSFSGANPFTNVDFNTANITSWSAVFTFVATECNSNGRNISFTATGNCRNSLGQIISGSEVTYPVSVTLPPITENCGGVEPPPSCCGLGISISYTPLSGPVAVGAYFDVTVLSVSSPSSNCHGRLFPNDLLALTPAGWVVDSVTSTPTGQDIRTGVNHSIAGTSFITNVIRLRAVECVPAASPPFTVSGACFNSFGNQLVDTFVSETAIISFPQVNANCEGGPPPGSCSSSYSHSISSISSPVSVGDTFYLDVTLTGTNAAAARTKNFALNQPASIPSGWTLQSINVIGLPPAYDPVNSEVDFHLANVTSFTVRYTFVASALNSGGTSNFVVSARCVDSSGNTLPGTIINYPINIQFPAVTNTGTGPTPTCCGLSLDVESVIPVGGKCEIAEVVFVVTSNSPTPSCAARTEPFAPTVGGPNVFTIISTETLLLDNSPAPFDARNGVDFRTRGVSGWKLRVRARAINCVGEPEPSDMAISFSGGCVNEAGNYIGGSPSSYSAIAIIGSPITNCTAICS
jgi:hypothetical protein